MNGSNVRISGSVTLPFKKDDQDFLVPDDIFWLVLDFFSVLMNVVGSSAKVC